MAQATHETLVTSCRVQNGVGFKTGCSLSKKVCEYLIAKFDACKRTGQKANPGDVKMRNSREENKSRRFAREEWLTATQITSFFLRLAAAQRKGGGGGMCKHWNLLQKK